MNKISNKYITVLICLVLASSTVAIFWPLTGYEFVKFDDDVYITQNLHVQAGLTVDSLIWAFTANHDGNWHPLTSLSHMLDCQLYGLDAGGHHFTNLLFHLVNTLLLFIVLKQMTGAIWQSAFVAAAFALHPLHVESVAWISERKDVLSTLFWFLTIWAYLGYVKRPSPGRYLLALVALAFGLMAKPMLVTLPFVLLLLDFWPLERFRPLGRLLWEKIPFFALSAVSGVVTFFVERGGGSVASTDMVFLSTRILNAFICYLKYIGKMIWPVRLAVFYPHPGNNLSIAVAGLAALLLVGITILTISLAKKYKYLPVGWLWFLGTLAPVIGLVQVGRQEMADRYTYVPLTGLFIIVAWGVPELLGKLRHRRIMIGASAVVCLLAMSICTGLGLRHWRNTTTLFGHAIEVTEDNYLAYCTLAYSLEKQGQVDRAIDYYKKSLRIRPHYLDAHKNLAHLLLEQNEFEKAAGHYAEAVSLKPSDANAHNGLGIAFAQQNKLSQAFQHFTRAVQLKPDFAEAQSNLGYALLYQGKLKAAVAHHTEAIRLEGDDVEVLNTLAWTLATVEDANVRNPADAVKYAQRACELTNNQQPELLDTLAAAYAATAEFDKAIETAQKALQLAASAEQKELAAEIENRLRLYKTGTPYIESTVK